MQPKIEQYDLGIKKIIPHLHHDDRGFLSEFFTFTKSTKQWLHLKLQ